MRFNPLYFVVFGLLTLFSGLMVLGALFAV